MTLIIGVQDEKDVVWVGSDSSVTLEDDHCIRNTNLEKVFFKSGFIIGCAGCVRLINLLRNYITLPKLLTKGGRPRSSESIMRELTDNLIETMRESSFMTEDNSRAVLLGTVLVAWPGNLYFIDGAFAYIKNPFDFEAIGSASSFAYGSMYVTKEMNLSPLDRIVLSLKAGVALSNNVKPPFRIINTNKKTFLIEE